MLFLTFQLGEGRYAIEARRVIEVLPLLALKRLPQAPRGVAGIFNLRGRPVVAIDLNELGFGKPSGERLTTRIILVWHKDSAGRDQPLPAVNGTGDCRRIVTLFGEHPGKKRCRAQPGPRQAFRMRKAR